MGSGGGGSPPAPVSAQSVAPVALTYIPVSLPSLSAGTVTAVAGQPGNAAGSVAAPGLVSATVQADIPVSSPHLAAGSVSVSAGQAGNETASVPSPTLATAVAPVELAPNQPVLSVASVSPGVGQPANGPGSAATAGQQKTDVTSASLTLLSPLIPLAGVTPTDTASADKVAEQPAVASPAITGSSAGTGTLVSSTAADFAALGAGVAQILAGGRGPARELDLGRGSSSGRPLDLLSVLGQGNDCAVPQPCHAGGN
jgi:hypothetical protein